MLSYLALLKPGNKNDINSILQMQFREIIKFLHCHTLMTMGICSSNLPAKEPIGKSVVSGHPPAAIPSDPHQHSSLRLYSLRVALSQ